MSLKREVGHGLFWVAIATIGTRGLAFLRQLVLARLLVPADFGLVGYAVLTINILDLFKELGFSSALIYRREDVEEAANTAFLAILSSSIGLYAISWLAAPLVAQFFKNEALVPVLRVLSSTLVISAISQVPLTLMARGMGFKNKVIPEMIAGIIGAAASVGLAFAGYGVWSIVYGQVIVTALTSVLVWFFCPWRPTMAFSRQVARELWDYGRHIIGSQIMVLFITNIDDVFVGRFLGDASLGLYNWAYDLSNQPATHLSRPVAQVMFPAFSKVQDDLSRLREVFFRSMKYVSLAAMPIAIVTMVFAKDFMIVAYGRKWADAVVPLQWLAVYGLARAIAVNMGNVFKAGGKPKWLFGIATVRLTVMAVALYPAIHYGGITGVAILSAVVSVLDFGLSVAMTNRVIEASWTRYARILLPMLLAAVVSALLSHELYLVIEPIIHPFIGLPLAGGLALLIYLGAMYAYDPDIRLVAVQVMKGIEREFRRLRVAQGQTRA